MGNGINSGLDESATMCNFASNPLRRIFGSLDEAARLYLNAACGWELTADDVRKIALRNYYFNRCLSLREGRLPAAASLRRADYR